MRSGYNPNREEDGRFGHGAAPTLPPDADLVPAGTEYYHGTTKENAESLVENGFDVDKNTKGFSESPYGLFVSTSKGAGDDHSAGTYGDSIVNVKANTDLVMLQGFSPTWMNTMGSSKGAADSAAWTVKLAQMGYDGIVESNGEITIWNTGKLGFSSGTIAEMLAKKEQEIIAESRGYNPNRDKSSGRFTHGSSSNDSQSDQLSGKAGMAFKEELNLNKDPKAAVTDEDIKKVFNRVGEGDARDTQERLIRRMREEHLFGTDLTDANRQLEYNDLTLYRSGELKNFDKRGISATVHKDVAENYVEKWGTDVQAYKLQDGLKIYKGNTRASVANELGLKFSAGASQMSIEKKVTSALKSSGWDGVAFDGFTKGWGTSLSDQNGEFMMFDGRVFKIED